LTIPSVSRRLFLHTMLHLCARSRGKELRKNRGIIYWDLCKIPSRYFRRPQKARIRQRNDLDDASLPFPMTTKWNKSSFVAHNYPEYFNESRLIIYY